MAKFSWYESRGGKTEARDKYLSGSDELKANFDTAVLYLTNLPRSDWTRPRYAKLKKCRFDFYEIRFFADNTQQRPIGFWVSDDDFVILLWAKEKGRKLIPENWCVIASDRQGKILDGIARTKPVLDDIKKQ
jgi:hypothetical protein